MKKLLIAVAATTLMCGSAFAQTTGPQPQTERPGMNNKERGSSGNTERGSMTKGTTGMSNGMSRSGTVAPDASGQGGSGPGSDQGGTRTAPHR